MLCEALVDPSSGSVVISSNGSLSVATYSCRAGYQLVGANSRSCRETGLWTGVPASCGEPAVYYTYNAVLEE